MCLFGTAFRILSEVKNRIFALSLTHEFVSMRVLIRILQATVDELMS